MYITEVKPRVFVVFKGKIDREDGYLLHPPEFAHTYDTHTKTADLVTPKRVWVGHNVINTCSDRDMVRLLS
jgi:hypothetical protein